MTDNTQIFLDFWRQYQWPEVKELVYRVYYDQTGRIVEYSREDKPGTYLDVSPEIYALQDRNAKVKNGKLILSGRGSISRLRQNTNGVACHPDDVCVVSDIKGCLYWSLTHDQD